MKKMIVIAGPCVVEDEKTTMQVAEYLKRVSEELRIELIFKASYRKANRTRGDSFQGIGDIPALQILKKVSNVFGHLTLTDIHTPNEVNTAATFVDILQIPAFLCRQTELLEAAARTLLPINIKKGQFASVNTMISAITKIRKENSMADILVTERGTTFGYDDLVVDMRNIVLLKEYTGFPVIIDTTHSLGTYSGRPSMIKMLGRCGIVAGADGVFFETHPNPKYAKSDANSMIALELVGDMLKELVELHNTIHK